MGTGVGEAMLIGAVTGAGTSAVTGGDPLKGAILGAAGSGIGASVAGATSGAASGATSGAASGTTAAPITNAAAGIPTSVGASGGNLTTIPNTVPNVVGQTGTVTLPSGANIQSVMMPGPDKDISMIGAGTQAGTQVAGGTPTFPSLSGLYERNKVTYPAALGALSSALGSKAKMPGAPDNRYSGPLSRFSYDPDEYEPFRIASGGLMDTEPARRMAAGGHLGSYSDGGQTLQGPGDGMSDSIPANIGGTQPARLADGEFVVPADVVSGLGNGSTDAGARQLYSMMDKVREARTGQTRQAPEINPRRVMPA